jgi:hypothetical protein
MEIFMFKNISTLVVLILLSSCQFKQLTEEDKLTNGIDGLTVPGPRNLNSGELIIARRICNNLIKKREFFSSLYTMTEKFRFNLATKSCTATSITDNGNFEATIGTSIGTSPEYIAAKDNYFRDIITDQSGNMKPICDIVNNNSISNTAYLGSYQYSYKILINNGYDRIEISKLVKNTDGSLKLAGIETLDFISLDSQFPTKYKGKFFGVEKERIRKINNCGGTTFSSVKQTWIEATTNF